MTRQDYVAIAAAINRSSDLNDLAPRLADVFAADNERFDRDRFYLACGFNDDEAREMREVALNERNEDRHGTMADAETGLIDVNIVVGEDGRRTERQR